MDPKDFATVAEEILRGQTPAHVRTAIGRAYYSVFNIAMSLLQPDVQFHSKDKHENLKKYLAGCGDAGLERLSSQLGDLKDRRNQADYDMVASPAVDDPNAAVFQIQLSKKLSAQLQSVLRGPNRKNIIEAIRQYRKDVLREYVK